ncbi:MAG: hypothetical protein IPL59_06670 [Candidatus Competibacteraceae bacterium]|nr:hypothetical protein [Candidatus Competibacteraceae bacterium]
MIRKLAEEEPQDFAIDGTENGFSARKTPDRQKRFFSGKEGHTVKNVIVSGLLDQQVKYLSPTQEGRKHHKKIADEEHITAPEGSDLYQIRAFKGSPFLK